MIKSEIDQLEKRYRINFVNSLSGFKSANLIGTVNEAGIANLAMFTSVLHLGANPAMMGFIMRPVSVPRHTYQNILTTGHFTINHVHESFYEKAHQTAARYDEEISEFSEVELTPFFSGAVNAPYVSESNVKIGLSFVEALKIEANNTILMIGAIEEVLVADNLVGTDGYIDLEGAGSMVTSCLDGYHRTNRMARLTYAKVEKWPEHITTPLVYK